MDGKWGVLSETVMSDLCGELGQSVHCETAPSTKAPSGKLHVVSGQEGGWASGASAW